jgi:hypothetical protein
MGDIIQQMIEGAAAIAAKILTGKQTKKTEIIVQQAIGAENLSILLNEFIKQRKYNEAENALFEQLEIYPTIDIYNVGLEFYECLDNLSDEELEKGSYSRAEIVQGIQDMTRLLIKITKHRVISDGEEEFI